MSELTLPSDPRTEEIVIGLACKDPSALAYVIQMLEPDDFVSPECQQLFETICEMTKYGERISKGRILSRMDEVGDEVFLTSIFECSESPDDIEHFVERLRNTSRRRFAASRCADIVRYACDGVPFDEVREEIGKLYVDLMTNEKQRAFLRFDEATDRALDELESIRKKDGGYGVRTLINAIDRKVAGFGPGDLILLGARPSVGKTATAVNIALNAASQGNGVLLFSLEQSQSQIMARAFGVAADTSVHKLLKGDFTEKDFGRIRDAANQQRDLPIFIGDVPGARLADLMTHARIVAANLPKLRLIIVDYLQLIRREGRENDTERVTRISAGLKQMARALKVPVLALSQLRRFDPTGGNAKKHPRAGEPEPTLQDLRQSGSLEQDADVVILLHRLWAEEDEDDESVKIQFAVAKHRNGPLGKEYETFHLAPMRLERSTTEDAPPLLGRRRMLSRD